MINIRPFDAKKDYPGLVALENTLWPDSPTTEESCRRGDSSMPTRLHWGRFVAENAGVLVGQGWYGQWRDHPQKFWIDVKIHPDHQRQGVGTALYEAVQTAIVPHNPILLKIGAREDLVARIAFFQKQGFAELDRFWESRLNVETFDPCVLQGAADRVRASGISIRTLADLADDSERDRKIYDLDCLVSHDMPNFDPHVPLPFDEYKQRFSEKNHHFLPDAWFIALDSKSGKYVGMSTLSKPSLGDYLTTGLTGVLREYRGRGIASALKLRAALYAKEKNIPEIRTGNAQVNKEMLAINEKMGFVKDPAWVYFTKELATETEVTT